MRRVRLSEAVLASDPTDPEGFRARRDRIGPRVGAERTGASLYELPPGQALRPYHYEHGDEEWALVVERSSGVGYYTGETGAAERAG